MSRLSMIASIILAMAAVGGPGDKQAATTGGAAPAPAMRASVPPPPQPTLAPPQPTLAPEAPLVATSDPATAEENLAPSRKTPMPPKPDERLTKSDAASTTSPRAESKNVRAAPDYLSLSPGEVQATPEMWFYEQSLRQYKDPDMAVRRAAEFRTAQRERRIESRRWFGLSNARPTASPDPLNGDYSAGWTSNNYYYPWRWAAGY